MTGQDVDDILTDLNDPDRVTWTLADRIRWINAAVRDIATIKPKSTTVTANLPITAGSTRQDKPADVIAVLDLKVNKGADGLTVGRHITTVAADRLGAQVPSWRSDTGPAIKHLVVDDRDPGAFYVWPAIKTGAWQVEALLHRNPVPIAALADTLPLDDSYLNAVAENVKYRCYARDSEMPGHAELAAAHYANFGQIMGIQVQRQKKASPQQNAPENPTYPVVDKNGA